MNDIEYFHGCMKSFVERYAPVTASRVGFHADLARLIASAQMMMTASIRQDMMKLAKSPTMIINNSAADCDLAMLEWHKIENKSPPDDDFFLGRCLTVTAEAFVVCRVIDGECVPQFDSSPVVLTHWAKIQGPKR